MCISVCVCVHVCVWGHESRSGDNSPEKPGRDEGMGGTVEPKEIEEKVKEKDEMIAK